AVLPVEARGARHRAERVAQQRSSREELAPALDMPLQPAGGQRDLRMLVAQVVPRRAPARCLGGAEDGYRIARSIFGDWGERQRQGGKADAKTQQRLYVQECSAADARRRARWTPYCPMPARGSR